MLNLLTKLKAWFKPQVKPKKPQSTEIEKIIAQMEAKPVSKPTYHSPNYHHYRKLIKKLTQQMKQNEWKRRTAC